MLNEALWKPSKFLLREDGLHANPDPACVAPSSRLNVELLAEALLPALRKHAQGRLLDLGCGSVPLYETYRPQVDSICCVDWAHSGHSLLHIDLAADLNQPTSLASAAFDSVVLTDVLEHVEQPEKLLAEIARLLSTGGVLIGSVPFLYRLHEEPHDHHRFTRHALHRMAVAQGFRVEQIEAYGWGSDVLFDILGKLALTLHWRIGGHLSAWIQRIGLSLRRSAFGRRFNSKHQNMPLGYLFVFRREQTP